MLYFRYVYSGIQKPPANDEFEFIIECRNLTETGIAIGKNSFNFKLSVLVCDAPAKAHILSIKGHNGYFSCPKCYIEGDYINNVMWYPEINFTEKPTQTFVTNRKKNITLAYLYLNNYRLLI